MPPRLNLSSARSLLRSTQCNSTTSHHLAGDHFLPQTAYTTRTSAAAAASITRSHHSFSPQTRLDHQRRLNSTSAKKGEAGEKISEDAAAGTSAEQPSGPSQDPLPHASEEAAEIARIMEKKACDVGGDVGGPELEQGTPVVDILKRDKEALKNMPKVLRDQLDSSGGSNGTRSFSTSSRRLQQDREQWYTSANKESAADLFGPESLGNEKVGSELPATESSQGNPSDEASVADIAEMINAAQREPVEAGQEGNAEKKGYKFDMPTSLPKSEHMKHRYDPVVNHFTKMIMWDGKLAQAQKHMGMILDSLRTAPAPKLDSRLLPNPGAIELPLNPIAYLTLIVDSVAPLMKIRQQKGAAGGGKSLPIPKPLNVRQRRRTAIQWIIDASEKRRDPHLPNRLAQELISVAEGRSGIWDKRAQLHKAGTGARMNVAWAPPRKISMRKY